MVCHVLPEQLNIESSCGGKKIYQRGDFFWTYIFLGLWFRTLWSGFLNVVGFSLLPLECRKKSHTHISHHTIWFLLKKTQKSASRMEDSWRIHILYVWKNQLSGKLLHLENLRKSFTGAAVLYLPRSFLNGGLLLGMATLVPWKWQLFAARKPLSDEILNLVSSPCFCKRCGIAT